MTPIERVQAAIDKLTALKAESTPGPWVAWKQYDPLRGEVYGIEWEAIDIITVRSYNAADAELIETLHRTIDPILATLERWLEYRPLTMEEPIVALADSILGVDS